MRQLSNAISDANWVPDREEDEERTELPQYSKKEISSQRKYAAHVLGRRGIKANKKMLRLSEIPQELTQQRSMPKSNKKSANNFMEVIKQGMSGAQGFNVGNGLRKLVNNGKIKGV